MGSKGLILFYLMILSIIQLSLDHVEANNLSPASHPEIEQVTESVVLLKVKPGLSPSQLTNLDNNITATKTIDGIKHFSYGHVRRVISSTLNFSHVAHYRFDSQEAADAYYEDPIHVAAEDAVVPLLDDFMVVQWVARPPNPRPVSLPAGSPVKVQLLKLKGDGENKTRCSSNYDGAKFGWLKQLTFGKNIGRPELGKGYSFDILGVYFRLNQMDNVEGFFGVGGCVEESLVVDFVTMLVDDHHSAAPPVAEPAGEPAAEPAGEPLGEPPGEPAAEPAGEPAAI